MSRLMQYTIVGFAIGWIADAVGASMPVSFMAALIGPPLGHIVWLQLVRR